MSIRTVSLKDLFIVAKHCVSVNNVLSEKYHNRFQQIALFSRIGNQVTLRILFSCFFFFFLQFHKLNSSLTFITKIVLL